jgi:hypothetical protein
VGLIYDSVNSDLYQELISQSPLVQLQIETLEQKAYARQVLNGKETGGQFCCKPNTSLTLQKV